jgi:hypothetical protein
MASAQHECGSHAATSTPPSGSELGRCEPNVALSEPLLFWQLSGLTVVGWATSQPGESAIKLARDRMVGISYFSSFDDLLQPTQVCRHFFGGRLSNKS